MPNPDAADPADAALYALLDRLDRLEELLEEMDELGVSSRADIERAMAETDARVAELGGDPA